MRDIRLYDSLTGELVPVGAGDAIRVEVRIAPQSPEEAVDVVSMRPLMLFGFLERLLQREGFGTKFLFDSPSGDTLYELSEENESSDSDEAPDSRAPAGTEVSLHEVARDEVDRWVNVLFGAGRDAEGEHTTDGPRVAARDALALFGHPAVAMYLLGTHYSQPLGDAPTGLATGWRNAARLREVIETLEPDAPSPPDMAHHVEAFRDALADDLDTPSAFVALFEWVLDAERRGGGVGDGDLRMMLEVFELDDLAAQVN